MGYGGKAEEEMVDNPPLDCRVFCQEGQHPLSRCYSGQLEQQMQRTRKSMHEIGYMHALSVTGVQSGVRGQWIGRGEDRGTMGHNNRPCAHLKH